MLQCVHAGTHLYRLVREHRGKDKHSRTPTWLYMHTGLLNVHTHEVRTGMGAHCLTMELREPHQGVSQPPPYPSCTQEKELRTEGFKAGGGPGSLDGRDSQPFWPSGPATAFSEPIPHPLPSPEPLWQQVELLRAGPTQQHAAPPRVIPGHLCWLSAPPPAPGSLPHLAGIWEEDG